MWRLLLWAHRVCLSNAQTSRFPLEGLVPLRSLKTRSGAGLGLAASPALGLLVTSDYKKNTLSVWGLPSGANGGAGASGGPGASAGGGAGGASAAGASGGGGGGLTLVCTLGGTGSPAPMQFKFGDGGGFLAFTPPTTTATTSGSGSSARPLLLVTDAGADAVHLVDVVGRAHAGYVAPPGSIAGPRGVAASGTSPLVAVSTWKEGCNDDHVVVVYRCNGDAWEVVRVIGGGAPLGIPGRGDGQLCTPCGLRFSGDGSAIVVAEFSYARASVFRVGDGGFVRHLLTELDYCPYDVEEVEGGWLAACYGSHTVEFLSEDGPDFVGDGWPSLGNARGGWGTRDGEFWCPTALAVVPGLGLVVREAFNDGRLQVFTTPDAIAMAAMSPCRVAWMAVVVRAALRRGDIRWQRDVAVGTGGPGGSGGPV